MTLKTYKEIILQALMGLRDEGHIEQFDFVEFTKNLDSAIKFKQIDEDKVHEQLKASAFIPIMSNTPIVEKFDGVDLE